MSTFAWWALILSLAIAFIVLSAYAQYQRQQAIRSLAQNWGWTYLERPQDYLQPTLWQLNLFNKGRHRRFYTCMQGQRDGAKVTVGDYRYVTGNGKNRQTYNQTVIVIESDTLQLPSFLLMNENLFHKIGNLFGYHDIDFDAYPEFSQRYLLRGSDETSIRARFNDGTLRFYQNQNNICTEGFGSLLVYYRAYRTLPPAQWSAFIEEALTAYRHLNRKGMA
jgi:hypothetical protein